MTRSRWVAVAHAGMIVALMFLGASVGAARVAQGGGVVGGGDVALAAGADAVMGAA